MYEQLRRLAGRYFRGEPNQHTLQPTVLDFGVARATGASVQTVSYETQAGQLVGTLPYMSPEQVAGDPASVDVRTDVYSLGVLQYELLCGRMPYRVKGRPIPEVMQVIQQEEPSRVGTASRHLRGDIETILYKALEKEPDRRYQSVRAMAEDIRRFLADEPLVARPASAIYQVRKFAKRNKVLVGGVVATILSLALGLAGVARYAVLESNAKRTAQEFARASERAADRAEMAAAAAALREMDVATAERHLTSAPESLRSWEWDHLFNSLDESLAVLPLYDDPSSGVRAPVMWGIAHAWFEEDDRCLHVAAAERIRGLPIRVVTFDAETHARIGRWRARDVMQFAPIDKGSAVYIRTNSGDATIRDALTGVVKEKAAAMSLPGDIKGLIPSSVMNSGAAGFRRPTHAGIVRATSVFDPRGNVVAFASERNVTLLSRKGPDADGLIGPHAEGMSNAAFDVGGDWIATVGYDRTLSVFSLKDGALRWRKPDAHKDAILAIAFSPDGEFIATGGQDRIIRFWSAETGELTELEGGVIAIEPGGRFCVRASRPSSLVDARTNKVVFEFPDQSNQFQFGPMGRRLAYRCLFKIAVIDLESLRVEREWSLPGNALHILADGRSLVVAASDRRLVVLDIDTGREKGDLAGHTGKIKAIEELPGVHRLVTGSDDRTVRIWDLEAMEEVLTLRGHTDAIWDLAVSPDQRTVYSASGDGTVRRWDTRCNREVRAERREYARIAAQLRPSVIESLSDADSRTALLDKVNRSGRYSQREVQIMRQMILHELLNE